MGELATSRIALWVAKSARRWQKRQGARHGLDRFRHDLAHSGCGCVTWMGANAGDSTRYAVVEVLAAPGGAILVELNYHEQRWKSRAAGANCRRSGVWMAGVVCGGDDDCPGCRRIPVRRIGRIGRDERQAHGEGAAGALCARDCDLAAVQGDDLAH